MYPLASLCGLWAAPEATRRGANLPPLVPAPSKVTQHKARHVSSRTKDTVFENVVFELEDARDELAAHPWLKPALFAPPAQRVPLQLRQAQRALHFLGLLKLRVAPELPIELWHEIVRHVFSCETSAAQVLRVGSRLELVAFPALPPEAELELLAAALQKRTGPSDVALLDSFAGSAGSAGRSTRRAGGAGPGGSAGSAGSAGRGSTGQPAACSPGRSFPGGACGWVGALLAGAQFGRPYAREAEFDSRNDKIR